MGRRRSQGDVEAARSAAAAAPLPPPTRLGTVGCRRPAMGRRRSRGVDADAAASCPAAAAALPPPPARLRTERRRRPASGQRWVGGAARATLRPRAPPPRGVAACAHSASAAAAPPQPFAGPVRLGMVGRKRSAVAQAAQRRFCGRSLLGTEYKPEKILSETS